jgi:enoyl-[acyl-carrier-protein] reductase (NADH)
VIVFLLGDLSRFVTGTAVHVDGGLHAAGGWHRRPDPG